MCTCSMESSIYVQCSIHAASMLQWQHMTSYHQHKDRRLKTVSQSKRQRKCRPAGNQTTTTKVRAVRPAVNKRSHPSDGAKTLPLLCNLLGPAADRLGVGGGAHIVVVVHTAARPHPIAPVFSTTAVELGTPRAVLVTVDPVTFLGALLGCICSGQVAP